MGKFIRNVASLITLDLQELAMIRPIVVWLSVGVIVSALSTETASSQTRGFGGPDAVENQIQSDRQQIDALFELEFLDPCLPIRLTPTPTICSVSPWTAGKGRRRRIEEAIRLIPDCSENRTGV